MQHFIKHFRREGAGNWICVEPATLAMPQGRIQITPGTRITIGTKFMNVDLARMLDEEYSRSYTARFHRS
ncbi:MAG: hypothetical protein ACREV8_12300 [Gammaproteobacteria bacterium]